MDICATVQPLQNPNKPPGEIEINKALSCLGYGSWNVLEPSKCKTILMIFSRCVEEYSNLKNIIIAGYICIDKVFGDKLKYF